MLPARISSKPQYVLHPLRAMRRAGRVLTGARSDGQLRVVRLPWGLELTVHESDAIGYSILVGRVFDPCVTETVYRIVDPGDRVVDVGANIGYLTSLAAARAGPSGRVLAVEPHPTVFELLQSNAQSWSNNPALAPVVVRRVALSNREGVGSIVAGSQFEHNMGLSHLAGEGEVGAHEVELRRLDELVDGTPIGLLKIDVEGHETEVLQGGSGLLEDRLVRDIIFEDHDPYPSEATAIVEGAGYQLVSLANDLRGVVLKAPRDREPVSAWPGPSYLATIDPHRSLARLQARGWKVGGIGIGR